MTDPNKTIAAMFGATDVATFLGIPACDDFDTLDADIAIIGAPCATPYPTAGAYCTGGPQAIRAGLAAYSNSLHHHDFDLGGPIFPAGNVTAVDCGDLPCTEADPEGNRAMIATAIRHMIEAGAVPIVLGGDDSVPIPMIEAFAGQGDVTILQIDAHIDWRDEVGGERLGLSSTMRRASEMVHVKHIVQVGQRAIGSARPGDVQAARDWGARFVSAREVAQHGIARAVDLIPKGAKVIIAFDCDALDPAIMPAVAGRAPGGLSYWHAVGLIDAVAERAEIAAFDLVEFVPAQDIGGQGALTAARLVANVIGRIARNKGP